MIRIPSILHVLTLLWKLLDVFELAGNPGKKSDNYYLVIGDNGGCAGGCDGCGGWQRLS